MIKGHPHTKGEVGNDIWIASGVTILSGVTIGDGVVIGANAVVSKNIPSYSVVAGNPARVVKYRFEESVMQLLFLIKGWDCPIERVLVNSKLLMSLNLGDFIAQHGVDRSDEC